MNKLLILLVSFSITTASFSQGQDGTEFGIDGTFSYSSGGIKSGTVGVGLKYGFVFNKNLILGPSIRYQRRWTNNTTTGQEASYNIYGGGVFLHYRFIDYMFGGVELEFLHSPYTTYGAVSTTSSNWVGTCLVGGGFSHLFNDSWRLNAGIYYDILDKPNPTNPNNNNPNSPLQPYVLHNTNGTVIPVLYRIAFFFPLT